MRILLVEDELRLAEALAHILVKEGYITDVVHDGNEGLIWAETNNYDVLILDRMLPGKEGVALLRELRAEHIQTPTIFLTAKDTVQNRVEGLDAGADDYLVKPFSKEELLARVRALTRRNVPLVQNEQLTIGRLALDVSSCQVRVEDALIKLSLRETQLLDFLIRNRGQVLSKELILNRIWGYESDVELRNVILYIFYLRKKIDFEKAGIVLDSVRSIGYTLREVT